MSGVMRAQLALHLLPGWIEERCELRPQVYRDAWNRPSLRQLSVAKNPGKQRMTDSSEGPDGPAPVPIMCAGARMCENLVQTILTIRLFDFKRKKMPEGMTEGLLCSGLPA